MLPAHLLNPTHPLHSIERMKGSSRSHVVASVSVPVSVEVRHRTTCQPFDFAQDLRQPLCQIRQQQ